MRRLSVKIRISRRGHTSLSISARKIIRRRREVVPDRTAFVTVTLYIHIFTNYRKPFGIPRICTVPPPLTVIRQAALVDVCRLNTENIAKNTHETQPKGTRRNSIRCAVVVILRDESEMSSQ